MKKHIIVIILSAIVLLLCLSTLFFAMKTFELNKNLKQLQATVDTHNAQISSAESKILSFESDLSEHKNQASGSIANIEDQVDEYMTNSDGLEKIISELNNTFVNKSYVDIILGVNGVKVFEEENEDGILIETYEWQNENEYVIVDFYKSGEDLIVKNAVFSKTNWKLYAASKILLPKYNNGDLQGKDIVYYLGDPIQPSRIADNKGNKETWDLGNGLYLKALVLSNAVFGFEVSDDVILLW